ncbi:JDVT-CTERM system glutamic-type intramembrane protease MrtJ [Pigmentiphaga litoralis]|uniref:Membrane protease YdiL (CAAX protease family) n=1 Tax=Pigmentiphaga litoralis TaxID=516702 RepID=A0A7Y9IR75_9BURK|nr:JDVT-CTERM system glutamic-type intramembrane protease [Pigmentiphaga litoralis]NYE24873.1 membrane protease YdiL (CAAX protease family) [Pigmentiphaga litoralis]NYE81513.1 membrane protease YdiL (CAAX protease family) [Pigmentiphaga litoralis]
MALLNEGGGPGRPPPISLQAAILMIVAAPVLEELAFRGAVTDLVHALLKRLAMADTSTLTRTNVITSLAFAACHLPYQPIGMAAAVLLPSLLLGKVREVTGSVVPCMVIHAWFNACYLMVMGV